ncbi:cyclase family protein [Candidatus Woesearchaeota archaeon]|nr:cyclase family protein [Candidatus Woesearchaeota archaeon]
MKIYDISREISEEMVIYKNRKENSPKISATRKLEEGANESKIDMHLHTGTHVDAPCHILEKGAAIERMSLERFMGKTIVLDFTKTKNSITKTHLTASKIKINKNEIVLLKTKNKLEKEFDFNFAYLEKTGAEYLASKKIKAVGIDSLGIERNQPGHDTHKILLGKNIPIFEGLDLSKIKQGKYFFHGLPLKIKKGDGSPVRAVLIG